MPKFPVIKSALLVFCVSIAIAFGVFLLSYSIQMNNREKELRNLAQAQVDVSKNTYDTMWKTISQQGMVAEEYRDSFSNVYIELVKAKFENTENVLFNWLTEAYPTFDPSLFKKIMTTIEAERIRFESAQNMLADIKREHDNLITKFPGNWLVKNRVPIDAEYVRSTRTLQAFEAGVDDSLGVFNQ